MIQVVKNKYPKSTELLLQTLVRDQIWAASFIHKNRRYEAVIDHDSFLSGSRLLADSLTDSLNNLLAELAISQKIYEGLREISPDSAALPYRVPENFWILLRAACWWGYGDYFGFLSFGR